MKTGSNNTIHIIGGGIIGLTSAWYLSEEGYDVTVIDKSNMSDGTSHGNAGMIVPSHFVPMAAPGVITQGIKWMFDSSSPFFIKPRASFDLIQWLWKFYRSCNHSHVNKCIPILYQYNEWSKELYKQFADNPRFSFCFEEKGLLMMYRTKHQEKEEIELAHKANALGINADILTESELSALEPDIKIDALGAVHFTGDAHLYPNKFIAQLKHELTKKDVEFLSEKEVTGFSVSGSKISHLKIDDGSTLTVDNVIVSGGSWTPMLLKKLGINILLQDGKGYSFTMEAQNLRPRIPTILTEAKVAITPMGNDLRIGGTLELGGLSSQINKNRLEGIVNSIPKYYPELKPTSGHLQKVWKGYRPCSADGMPFVGRSKKINNMIVATGHGMMGMSMGPATGKLVCEIVSHATPSIDLHLMQVER